MDKFSHNYALKIANPAYGAQNLNIVFEHQEVVKFE